MRPQNMANKGKGLLQAGKAMTGQNSQGVNKGGMNQRPTQGRVNYVSTKEATEATDMITGTFSVMSKPALILFDPGATHSFISISFTLENEMPSFPLEKPYVVESPGAKMKSQTKTNEVEIDIHGEKFKANLIHLQLRDLDVILGMDWLYKYKAKVDCEDKLVYVTSPNNLTLRIKSQNSFLRKQKKRVCSMVAEGVMQIPMVKEFADVFPEELPGEPPDREVEFKIELKPGTEPITRQPYHMSRKELVELKKQIDELLDKKFRQPSISSWVAPVLFAKNKDVSSRLRKDYQGINVVTLKINTLCPGLMTFLTS